MGLTLLWIIMLASTWLKQLAVTAQENLFIGTDASCGTGFEWASENALSPCKLASSVFAACSPGGSYEVRPLPDKYHYDPPSKDKGTINSCSCSWAAYNLLSMCTTCQKNTSQSIFAWQGYSAECGELASRPYVPMTDGNSKLNLPSYATYDPSKWYKQTFNVTQARYLNSASQSQATSASSSPTSSPAGSETPSPRTTFNIGAVVGSILGGTAVLLGLAVAAIILKIRRASSYDSESCVPLTHNGSRRASMTVTSYRGNHFIEPYPYTTSPKPMPGKSSYRASISSRNDGSTSMAAATPSIPISHPTLRPPRESTTEINRRPRTSIEPYPYTISPDSLTRNSLNRILRTSPPPLTIPPPALDSIIRQVTEGGLRTHLKRSQRTRHSLSRTSNSSRNLITTTTSSQTSPFSPLYSITEQSGSVLHFNERGQELPPPYSSTAPPVSGGQPMLI
ncbi:hypothetical protein Moror_7043 [Moniliophthora roreri MCA 2997]|uniref:Uncharacterized protein n=2 Tax=Moniliophthora roreri TaxID=221103 RepID=V2XVE2_MONRO|nr:hypothetical protein Moror_7043 [Moniliophthora roreri MCA 2997]KAI3619802.1 hypothetical protein WG66_002845 [Moniliophthora roreri]